MKTNPEAVPASQTPSKLTEAATNLIFKESPRTSKIFLGLLLVLVLLTAGFLVSTRGVDVFASPQ